jgi:hypothetical protein
MDEQTAKKARKWNNIIVLLFIGFFLGYVTAEVKNYYQDKSTQTP